MLLNSLKVISIAVGIVAQVPNVNPDDWNELAMDLCTDFYTLKGVSEDTISLVSKTSSHQVT